LTFVTYKFLHRNSIKLY